MEEMDLNIYVKMAAVDERDATVPFLSHALAMRHHFADQRPHGRHTGTERHPKHFDERPALLALPQIREASFYLVRPLFQGFATEPY